MKKVLILGSGMVGRTIARVLAHDFEVTVIDISAAALKKLAGVAGITTLVGDLQSRSVKSIVAEFDCVVGAMPGRIAYSVLKKIISAGVPIVDISFFEEDPLLLDQLARKHRTPFLVDFGVAPGLSNLMLGREISKGPVSKFICYCGGLPYSAEAPWFHKSPFEIAGSMDVCTRPARMRIDDEIITRPAMSDYEIVYFDGLGGFEAFSTDGLRTLLRLPIATMIEKTIRHIGFRRTIRPLIESGFFSENPLHINGVLITPFEVTRQLLTKAWALEPKEKEFTLLRLLIEGTSKVRYDLVLHGDTEPDTTSMAKLAGYPAAAAVHMFAQGLVRKSGVITPEEVGMQSDLAEFVLNFLRDRGIEFTRISE